MTELTTQRFVLRPWTHADAERLLEIRSDPAVSRWLASPDPWTSLGQAECEIAMWRRRVDADGPHGVWAIVDGEVALGSVSLLPIRGGPETEMGWYLHPDATGRGVASEAASAVLANGLASGLRRIWALMWRDNRASARVASRIGMRELGVLVDPWYGTEADAYSRMFIAHEHSHA